MHGAWVGVLLFHIIYIYIVSIKVGVPCRRSWRLGCDPVEEREQTADRWAAAAYSPNKTAGIYNTAPHSPPSRDQQTQDQYTSSYHLRYHFRVHAEHVIRVMWPCRWALWRERLSRRRWGVLSSSGWRCHTLHIYHTGTQAPPTDGPVLPLVTPDQSQHSESETHLYCRAFISLLILPSTHCIAN